MPDTNAVHPPNDGANTGEAAPVSGQALPRVVYGITKGGQPKRETGTARLLALHFAARDPRVLVVDHDGQDHLDRWPTRSHPRPSPTE